MSRTVFCLVAAILLSGLIGFACAVDQKPLSPQAIDVYFSPKGGCQDAIVREINAAQTVIHVQAYSFTSAPIAKALIEAKKRGVQVDVVIDQERITEKYCEATFFANQGIQA
jgi:phosphatidylserine/phosphatidylglycerophosphate/cardiolipin synthase-like enzyme